MASPRATPPDIAHDREALTKAGLPPMRLHELRHTFGTLAIQSASILQVQNWLGHTDIKTTQIYLPQHLRQRQQELLID